MSLHVYVGRYMYILLSVGWQLWYDVKLVWGGKQVKRGKQNGCVVSTVGCIIPYIHYCKYVNALVYIRHLL